jgi:hypothetical protein
MMASESSASSKLIEESIEVRVPKSISDGKADGVSSEDDCGVATFVAADDEGEGIWLVDAKIDVGGESNDGTAPLKGLSLGSPFRGTEKVNEVFLRETFSS